MESETGLRAVLQLLLGLFDREFTALILALPRVYAFMALSGLLAATAVPRPARVAAVLAFAIVPAGITLPSVDGFDRAIPSLAAIVAKEAAIGVVLGSLVGWVFWAVQSAGALIDNQRGSSMASSIDPLQGQETSTLGIAFSQVFLTYLFVAGGALPIVGLLYRSYVLWPVTSPLPVLTERFPTLMLGVFDHAFEFVVIVAGPIVAVMFLAEFALAMVSRFAPQIQVFILAMPIKSGLAMFMLIFYLATLLPYAAGQTSLFSRYLDALSATLRVVAPPPAGPGAPR